MIAEIIKEEREHILKTESLIPREKLSDLILTLELRQILTIVGVRRSGKSTLMKELICYIISKKMTVKENILYINLENPFFHRHKDDLIYLTEIYKEFKKNINKKHKVYVFFDEIQFFRDWQVFIKNLYEKNEAKIILTGSNSKLLSPELATLLSGRTINIHLFPYSFQESQKAVKSSFRKYLEIGGFPEIVKLKDNQQIKLVVENYYKSILYQDVIPRFGIKNSLEMENLSYYLISNISKEVSYNTLKQISKLEDKTIKQYVSYLEDANLLYVINNYDHSLKKQIGNKKKIYAVDVSFVNFLGFHVSRNFGRLLENNVFLELKRNGKDVFFFSHGEECDFVVKEGHKITECIQVSLTLEQDKTRDREIQGLLTAMDYFSLDEGLILTEDEEDIVYIGPKKIKILPFAKWAGGNPVRVQQ